MSMNPHPSLAAETLRSSARSMSPLKTWRKQQLVVDPQVGARRSMRLTDIPREYGIATSTWHAWEQAPGDPDFRRPSDANMARICDEITKGAVSPADFYPPPVPQRAANGG